MSTRQTEKVEFHKNAYVFKFQTAIFLKLRVLAFLNKNLDIISTFYIFQNDEAPFGIVNLKLLVQRYLEWVKELPEVEVGLLFFIPITSILAFLRRKMQ